jgi:hypothetical protein
MDLQLVFRGKDKHKLEAQKVLNTHVYDILLGKQNGIFTQFEHPDTLTTGKIEKTSLSIEWIHG